MSHEMETGQRKDAQGKTVPAWFIQTVTATYNGKTVLSAQWGPAVAKNPFLVVQVQGRREGRQGADHLDRQQGRQAHRRSRHRLNGRGSAKDGGTTTPLPEQASQAPSASSCAASRAVVCCRCVRRGARAGQRRRRDREVPRRAAGRQSGRAVGGARRGPVEEAARPEERVARALRPRARPRRRQGRLRAAAALFRRRRSRAGPRDAPRLVHGHAAGLHRGRREEGSRSAAPTASADMEALVAYVTVRVARREDERVALASEGAGGVRARREDVLLPRRPARLRLRDLPRRGRQADPAAGPAQPDDARKARRRRTRRGPRTACRRASCARSSGGSTTASASSASPSSSSRRTRRSR